MKHYVQGRLPVILTDLVDGWGAHRWVSAMGLSNVPTVEEMWSAAAKRGKELPAAGDQLAVTGLNPLGLKDPSPELFLFKQLSRTVSKRKHNQYMDLDFPTNTNSHQYGEVRRDLLRGYSTPALFGKDMLDEHCPKSLPNRWFLLAGPGSGSKYHVDPCEYLLLRALILVSN